MSGGGSSSGNSNDNGSTDYRIGGGRTAYTEKDAARDTGSSIKDVNRTWHQARDDDPGLTQRHEKDFKYDPKK